MEEAKKQETNYDEKNFLEWVVFGLSLLGILGVFGYLIYHTYQHEDTPPALEVEFSPEPSPYAPYRYHVVVYNRGGTTAQGASIELLLKKDTVVLDNATLSFSWIPQTSRREGWVVFSEDPAKADTIVANVLGYNRP